jgi:CRP-like cAMP-binding protein
MTFPVRERSSENRPLDSPSLLPRSNALFASLSEADRRRLAPLCERVHLRQGSVIADIGAQVRHAYFPIRGMISLHAISPNGTLIQVAAIHSAGILAPSLFVESVTPYRIAAPLACDVYRMRALTFVETCKQCSALDVAVGTFRNRYSTHIGQTAVCHHFHPLLKRVCRWILVCADCARSEMVELTQDRLAQMLGTSRESVSRVATRLQDEAVIRQRHGRIHIVNRPALMTHACDCYAEDRHVASSSGSRHR